MNQWTQRLGRVGVWRSVSLVDPAMARVIEGMGYRAIWLGGSPGSRLEEAERLLDATDGLTVATGVVNIWNSDPGELARSFHRIEVRHPGRLLLGIGTGHREATPQRKRPLDAMSRYLDVLDEGTVPTQRRVLSALGPRMLALAAERSAGTHPYLTIPPQTAEARQALGPDALVAPEQTVVFDSEIESARSSARRWLTRYLQMINYTTTMRRGGFTAEDIAGQGSDRLVDQIVAQGDATRLAGAITAHLQAGADQVCIQVIPADGDVLRALGAVAEEINLPGQR
jgi:probable F420-dependent oxidoreductase